MKNLKNTIVLICCLVATTTINAIHYVFNTTASSNIAVVNNTYPTQDNLYSSYSNPNWVNEFKNIQVKNKVTLRWDRDNTPFIPTYKGIVRVELEISYETLSGSNLQLHSGGVITLELSNDTASLANDLDISSKLFYDAVKVNLKVISIKKMVTTGGGSTWVSVTPGASPDIPFILVENTIEIDRIYSDAIDKSKTVLPPPFTNPFDDFIHITLDKLNSNGWQENVKIQWIPMPHAEAYELEYLFIPKGERSPFYSTFNAVSNTDFSNFEYSFRHNSNRVRLTGVSSYSIPNIFEEGYLLVRMRLIGFDFQSPSEEIFSDWTLPESGLKDLNAPLIFTPPVLPSILGTGVIYLQGFAPEVNWSSSTSYSENGKQNTQITYFDGTLRSRQSISKSATYDYAIVGQSVFDNFGRETVTIPATPTGDNKGYSLRPKHNVSSISGDEFNYSDFDLNSTNAGLSNEVAIFPLDVNYGTASYYSQNITSIVNAIGINAPNLTQSEKEMHGYVPNGQGWMFNQVELMNDGTGRPARTGGIGFVHGLSADHGSGIKSQKHEMQYGYETPSQFELDMLFGNEVGYSSHYKKVTTKDPNGQNVVAYYNLSGQVIATALSGDISNSPSLLPLPSNGHSYSLTETINAQAINEKDGTKVSWKSFYLPNPTTVEIGYTLTPEKLTIDDCENLCFDCKYKMSISLKDNTGKEWYPQPGWISVGRPEPSLDMSCLEQTYSFAMSPNPASILLPPGQYTLYKELKVDLDILDQYTELLLSNEACLKSLENFISETISTTCEDCEIGCETCADALTNVANEIAITTSFCTNNNINPEDHEPLLNLKNAEYELKERCNGLCQPKTPCQALYETILLDISPGGQYARTQEFDSELNPINNAVQNSVLNDANNKQCNITTGNWSFTNVDINWRNPIDINDPNSTTCRNYKDASGKISYILVIDGLPEIKTGGSYVNFPGDDNIYIKPQDLKHVSDFIKYWQESWASSLALFHPEFCYYQKCNAIKETYEYDLLMNAEFSGAVAKEKGYYNPIGLSAPDLGEVMVGSTNSNIQYSEGLSPARDLLFQSGGSLYNLGGSGTPNFKEVLNNFSIQYLVNGNCTTVSARTIWELFEENKVAVGLDPLTDDCASEVVWPYLRALYQMRKQQYLNKYYYSTACNGTACGEKNCALVIEQPRWITSLAPQLFPSSAMKPYVSDVYKLIQISSTLSNLMSTDLQVLNSCTNVLNQADLEDAMDEDMEQYCSDNCKGVAESWLSMLKDCPSLQNFYSTHTEQQIQDLINDLASVCVGGCDLDNPYGSINVNPSKLSQYTYHNIEEVFEHHLGSNWFSLGICDPLLISFPYEYGHDYVASDDPKTNECACETNKYPTIDPNHCDPGPGNTAQGCACDKSPLLGELAASLDGTIEDLKCKNCIICDDLEDITQDFMAIYGRDFTISGPYLSNIATYQELLTNWFNRKFGFNLTYQEYHDFALSCLGDFEPTSWINLWQTVAIDRKISSILPLETQWSIANNNRTILPSSINKATVFSESKLNNDGRIYLAYASNSSDVSYNIGSAFTSPATIHASAEANNIACHCEKVLAIKKMIDDGINNGVAGEQLFASIYSTTWSSKYGSHSFTDISTACCNLLNKQAVNLLPVCDNSNYEFGAKFNVEVKDHIDLEFQSNPTNSILNKLAYDNPCIPDQNTDEKGYLDVCACKKLKQLKNDWNTYMAGSPNPALSYEAWVFQQEGVSGNDLTYLETKCKEMWETGADKDNTGAIIEAYTPVSNWDDVAKVNLNNYAFQNDWKVPKKFKCPPPTNNNVDPKDGGDFTTYVPPCIESLNCDNLKTFLKAFILANPGLYPDPINLIDLEDPGTLTNVAKHFVSQYKNIISGRDFLVTPSNQPYIDFWNAFGTYLDNQLNHCTPKVTRDIHYYLHSVSSIYICLSQYNAVKKDPPCETCWAANTSFINDFMAFLNHATSKPFPKYLYQTKWYLKEGSSPPKLAYDFPEFYANTGLYNGTSPATLRYFIQQNYSNSFVEVVITDNAGYYMRFEINLPGYKPYWNIGEILEFSSFTLPDMSGCMKNDIIQGIAKVAIPSKFWNNTDYPELASCPNISLPFPLCNIDVPITIRMYTHDLYTQVPCLGCGKLCNRSIAQGIPPVDDECGNDEMEWGMDAALATYSSYIDQYLAEFKRKYLAKCINANEEFSFNHSINLHHFMLYYYDQAGQLIKTVPPEGIDIDNIQLSATDRQNIANGRHALASAHRQLNTNFRAIPGHWLITQYKNNTIGQPIWSKTPDGGESRLWYDELGRVVCSQNSKQHALSTPEFGYTAFDELGRAIEGGVLIAPTFSNSESILEYSDDFGNNEIKLNSYTGLDALFSGDRIWQLTPTSSSLGAFSSSSSTFKLGYTSSNTTPNIESFSILDLPNVGTHAVNFEVLSLTGGSNLAITIYEFQTSGNWVTILPASLISTTGSKSYSFSNIAKRLKIEFTFHGNSQSNPAVEIDNISIYQNQTIFNPNNSNFIAGNYWPRVHSAQKKEVTLTLFDKKTEVANLDAVLGSQTNTRNRVASAFYYEELPTGVTQGKILLDNMSPSTPISGYAHATHYSYDIHGNAYTVVQDIPELGAHFNSQFFTLRYKYDLISGNTNEVQYQQPLDPYEAPPVDAFYHKYFYDLDNRLTYVLTSRDGWHWEKDAHYQYYLHNALMRTELGELKVQGIDYSHTIEGWIKTVNSANISMGKDMGKDGQSGTPHAKVAKDAFGYSLSYYNGDYTPSGAGYHNPEPNLEPSAPSSASDISNHLYNLYNGNIRSMQTCIPDISKYTGSTPSRDIAPHTLGFAYRYDQLNRLRDFKTFDNLNYATNNWGSTMQSGIHRYAGSYEYDAMGNITHLKRIANQTYLPSGVLPIGTMDDLTYNYSYSGSKLQNNKLLNVNDAVSTTFVADLENQAGNNYTYDELGNLMSDISEEITNIEWSSSGKIKKVNRTSTSAKSDVEMRYGVGNARICKVSMPHINTASSPAPPAYQITGEKDWTYTWYIADAAGNTMATYKQKYVSTSTNESSELSIGELYIYGNEKVGYIEVDQKVSSKTLLTPNVTGYFDQQTWSSSEAPVITNSPIADNISSGWNTITPVAGVIRGQKRFELANHLGNVLVVITDRKLAYDITGDLNWEFFQPYVRVIQDYYPFGSDLPGRSFRLSNYRFGFNNQEKEGELGDYYAFEYRIHDSRLGRFLSVDPLESDYPWNSTYAFAENRVIDGIDLEGSEWMPVTSKGKIIGYTWSGYTSRTLLYFDYKSNQDVRITSYKPQSNTVSSASLVHNGYLYTWSSNKEYGSGSVHMEPLKFAKQPAEGPFAGHSFDISINNQNTAKFKVGFTSSQKASSSLFSSLYSNWTNLSIISNIYQLPSFGLAGKTSNLFDVRGMTASQLFTIANRTAIGLATGEDQYVTRSEKLFLPLDWVAEQAITWTLPMGSALKGLSALSRITKSAKGGTTTVYRNFGWNEYKALRANGNNFEIGSNFGSKQFWLDDAGINWWNSTSFSKNFTAKITVNNSALNQGYKFLDAGKYRAISFDSREALNIFNKNMKIEWIQYK